MQDNCIKPISNSETQTFSLIYCVAGIVIVCHFVHSFVAFVCQEIKGLLTYLFCNCSMQRYGTWQRNSQV